jgi:VWA domain-containing protein
VEGPRHGPGLVRLTTGYDQGGVRKGLEAREQGDEAAATRHLGRAVQLAHESGNADMTTRLTKVVDGVDPSQGTVRLKRDVGRAAAMDLELESTTTRRARRPGQAPS